MYLLACTIVMAFAAFQTLRTFGATLDRITAGDGQTAMGQTLRNLGLSLVPAGLMAAPLLASFADALLFTSGKPVAVSSGKISVALGLAGALAVLAVVVVRGVRGRHQPGFWFVGWVLASALSAGVALAATASQLAFTSSADSGMVSFVFFVSVRPPPSSLP